MVKTLKPILLPLLALTLALSGCSLGADATPTPLSPEAVMTSAAITAQAMGQARFGLTPSPQAAEELIATAAGATPTPTLAPTAQASTPAPTQPASNASGGAVAVTDRAEYVSDVTIPDGTTFAPGDTFDKTWRISNTGPTTWTTAYNLVFIDGNALGAEQSIPLEQDVAPGEQVDITVPMTAPDAPGSYTSYWKLRTPAGQLFGFGSEGKEAIWVKITVSSDGSGGSDVTPNPAAVDSVSGVSLEVDAADVTGACPHVFLMTATIVLTQPATVSYYLEVGGTGANVRTPPPATRNLPAGTHQVVFELSVPADFSGWAMLHLTQPGATTSDQVPFSLTCG